MISTEKRISYALAYIELGLLEAAREELSAVPAGETGSSRVLCARIELAMAESDWPGVILLGEQATRTHPTEERPWVAWAFALRELENIAEAREVLLRGEQAVKRPGVLMDYNLACYHALLGDLKEARRRLNKVIARDPAWRDEAAGDPDLAALHPKP